MTANRIIHHIFNQPDIRHVDQASLEQLVETYPYFAAARLLLAQKQFIQRPDLTAPTLKRAQLYSSNPQHLHQLLTETAHVEETPVVAKAEPIHVTAAPVNIEEPEDEDQQILGEVAEAVVSSKEPAIEASTPLDIEELEDEISAEDQQILDEIEAEDRANAALAAQQAIVAPEKVAQVVEEEIVTEEVDTEEEIAVDAIVPEVKTIAQEEIAVEATTPEEKAIPQEEITIEATTPEEKTIPQEQIAAAATLPQEKTIVQEEKVIAPPLPLTETHPVTPEEPDEIIALDCESIKETAAFEAEKASDAPDEIVALDYDALKEEKAFKTQIAVEAPDEIVAIDYEALKETVAFEAEKASDAPDEVVAIDYEALREEKPHYEPEIEEEEIEVAAAEPAQTAGIAIPAASVIIEKEEVADDEELEEGPIRIHPIDTPEEETVLTFQPLYTEDYFAYKKLKDPNTAEMMNDKAQAEMRSFTDWLRELKDNFVAGKTTKDWYHSQMHRLYEDDEPEVSERVEKMAMESITLNDDIVSETLAEIWVRQHQHAKAIVIYQKLSLLNPDKNAYFAQKIKELQLLTDNNK